MAVHAISRRKELKNISPYQLDKLGNLIVPYNDQNRNCDQNQ